MDKKEINKGVQKLISVETLIKQKMMFVNAEKYYVGILAELWNLYSDEAKANLCQNILTYCKVKNAFDQVKVRKEPVLLIAIKDSSDNVAPFAYFKDGKITKYGINTYQMQCGNCLRNKRINLLKTKIYCDFEQKWLKISDLKKQDHCAAQKSIYVER